MPSYFHSVCEEQANDYPKFGDLQWTSGTCVKSEPMQVFSLIILFLDLLFRGMKAHKQTESIQSTKAVGTHSAERLS